MASEDFELKMLQHLRETFKSALGAFASSSSSSSTHAFTVVRSIPSLKTPRACPVKSLYVLDSSFNPPTKAHMRIALTALMDDDSPSPKRLLLLLATQNADKAPKPASFQDRLVMMVLFAKELRDQLGCDDRGDDGPFVDVGITKMPYFHDKATAIEEAGIYHDRPTQVHLTGFDTVIRIFNTKYYPPDHKLAPLEPFLSKHRLRVTYRTDDEWGGKQDQDKYIEDIANGKRDCDGAKRGWAQKIDLVEGKLDGEDVISSTLARKAAKTDPASLEKYMASSVRDWIISEKLYQE